MTVPSTPVTAKPAAPRSQGHARFTVATYAPTTAVVMNPMLDSCVMREKRRSLFRANPVSSSASTPHASTAPLQNVVPSASIASATRNSTYVCETK
jgi:hypothetical protein